MEDIKIGDKVKRTSYGYLDIDEYYEVVDIKPATSLAQGTVYVIRNSNGREISVGIDDIFLI